MLLLNRPLSHHLSDDELEALLAWPERGSQRVDDLQLIEASAVLQVLGKEPSCTRTQRHPNHHRIPEGNLVQAMKIDRLQQIIARWGHQDEIRKEISSASGSRCIQFELGSRPVKIFLQNLNGNRAGVLEKMGFK